jgi:hypothetical protein
VEPSAEVEGVVYDVEAALLQLMKGRERASLWEGVSQELLDHVAAVRVGGHFSRAILARSFGTGSRAGVAVEPGVGAGSG